MRVKKHSQILKKLTKHDWNKSRSGGKIVCKFPKLSPTSTLIGPYEFPHVKYLFSLYSFFLEYIEEAYNFKLKSQNIVALSNDSRSATTSLDLMSICICHWSISRILDSAHPQIASSSTVSMGERPKWHFPERSMTEKSYFCCILHSFQIQ